jgi:rod shape-determining protein MreC
MVGMPSRHRSLALLAGVLLAQVLMLAVQVKRDSRGRLIRVWSMTAVTPFEKGGAWGFGKIRGVWDHYFALQGTTRQNEELRSENDQLKLTISQLQSKAAEADRLALLLNFRQSHEKVPMVMARVIGAGAGTASHTIEIDRGERDGIRRNMAVIRFSFSATRRAAQGPCWSVRAFRAPLKAPVSRCFP